MLKTRTLKTEKEVEMKKTHLDIWAKKIFKETGFKPEKEISRGYYYTKDKIRSLVFAGQYQDKPAVLKVYDDPRLTDEPLALQAFNETNESEILKAPKLYDYKLISSKQGWLWLIMEQLPENSRPFQRPIKPEKRMSFLNLFLEYRRNFPEGPHRLLTLSENLPAHLFHIFRINRWFQLANDKEIELGEKPVLDPEEFLPRYQRALDVIIYEFGRRKEMIWSHGHFSPSEVFKHPSENIYYLTDFMHTKMYPEFYELAFIIWSDWIMSADWRMDYAQWSEEIEGWFQKMKQVNMYRELKIDGKEFICLLRVSLIERCLGTILADICATDKPRPEKEKRLALVYQLLDELLKYVL